MDLQTIASTHLGERSTVFNLFRSYLLYNKERFQSSWFPEQLSNLKHSMESLEEKIQEIYFEQEVFRTNGDRLQTDTLSIFLQVILY